MLNVAYRTGYRILCSTHILTKLRKDFRQEEINAVNTLEFPIITFRMGYFPAV